MRVPSLCAAVLGLSLAGCNGDQSDRSAPMSDSPSATQTDQLDPTQRSADPETAESLMARADLAVAADRLFEPAADNAFELYLAVLDAKDVDADSAGKGRRRLLDSMADADPRVHARAALNDLFPYGLRFAERVLDEGGEQQARRWVQLLARVRPDSPGLLRLEEKLAGESLALTGARQSPPTRASLAAIPTESDAAVPSPEADTAAPTRRSPPVAETGSVAEVPQSTSQPTAPPSSDVSATGSMSPEAAFRTQAAAPAEVGLVAVEEGATRAGVTDASVSDERRSTAIPEQLLHVAPRYPPRARRQRIEGWVALRFRISPQGKVDQVSVTDAEPEGIFDREAVGTVSRWQYAESNTEHWLERRIDFLLER